MVNDCKCPALVRLNDWWFEARKQSDAPSLAEFDQASLDVDRARCVLLRISAPPLRLTYERFGAVPMSWHGRDMTGRAVEDWPAHIAAKVRQNVEATLQRGIPIYQRQPASAPGQSGETEKLLLPLRGMNHTIGYVLVATYELTSPTKRPDAPGNLA